MSLLLSLIFAFSSLIGLVPEQNATVIINNCYVYSSPSFESEKILNENGDILVLNKNQEIVVIEEINEFVKINLIDSNIQGYIYKYYISQNSTQTIYPTFNASIRYNATVVYDLSLEPTDVVLQAGERVRIYKGYDDKEEYTQIQFVDENGELIHGFVKTSNLKPDGVSSLLIIGISIIAACVTIILSIIFIKKKKTIKKV